MSLVSDNLESLLRAAADAQRMGDFESAEHIAQRALEHDHDSAAANFLLGTIYARKGQPDKGVMFLRRTVAIDPNAYEALISLCTINLEQGRYIEALEVSARAVSLRPSEAVSHNANGRSLLALRRLDEATEQFRKAIALNPRMAAAHRNLGRTKQLQGRDGEAARAYACAAELAPTQDNLLAFARILLNLCDYQAAIGVADDSLSRYPASPETHLILCGAHIELGRREEAEIHLQKALELDPDCKCAVEIAARQRLLGHVDAANENLRQAIERSPGSVDAYGALMHNKRITDEDRPWVERARALLQDQPLSPTEEISLHYGLGKALEDLKDFETAMRHYDEANRLSRVMKLGEAPFDREARAAHYDRISRAFTPRSKTEDTETSELPILIVGMMRSGTTLAEQILSNHSKVAPAGEQLFWVHKWSEALQEDSDTARPEAIAVLGREYVAFLQRLYPGAERVTDKMPGNFTFLGLIHQALPNARIIHMRRNAADNCISIWATPNHVPPDGGHRKSDLVFAYRQYMALMDHWRSVLPTDRFLEVDYEALVSDSEVQVRRMLSFCALEWEVACLHPESNPRLIATPSAWQVRQPVYKTSMERWKRFEPYLGEFRDLTDLRHQ